MAVPQAERLFKPGQKIKDAMLRQFQYTISAILRLLDVLGHMLLPLLPADQRDRVFMALNDARTLVLHMAGTVNYQRNQLALRAINPTFRAPVPDKEYTMAVDEFKDTVNNFTTMQKSLREARGGQRPCAF